jgi:hypothetical protein
MSITRKNQVYNSYDDDDDYDNNNNQNNNIKLVLFELCGSQIIH